MIYWWVHTSFFHSKNLHHSLHFSVQKCKMLIPIRHLFCSKKLHCSHALLIQKYGMLLGTRHTPPCLIQKFALLTTLINPKICHFAALALPCLIQKSMCCCAHAQYNPKICEYFLVVFLLLFFFLVQNFFFILSIFRHKNNRNCQYFLSNVQKMNF